MAPTEFSDAEDIPLCEVDTRDLELEKAAEKQPMALSSDDKGYVYPHHTQRRLVLIMVCIAVLLDNMLAMVIVPIVPDYLHTLHQKNMLQDPKYIPCNYTNPSNRTFCVLNETASAILGHPVWSRSEKLIVSHTHTGGPKYTAEEDMKIGVLFASKALFQLLTNPLSGTVVDRVGADKPMLAGLAVLFISTAMFAFGKDYAMLFTARSAQGIASAFLETAGLAMIADCYRDEAARTKAQGTALAFLNFGFLFGPSFGGILYHFVGKYFPFILLNLVILMDMGLLAIIMYVFGQREPDQKAREKATPIYKLILDPYIAVCAGAIIMSDVSLAFLEPTIAIWMQSTMDASEWQVGLVWLPTFIPYIIGILLAVKVSERWPSHQWIVTSVGLVIEGLGCLFLPFCNSFWFVIFPLMLGSMGLAMIDTIILPSLAYLVDIRHTSIYGSVYAIADMSFCLSHSVGPIIATALLGSIGFKWMNIGIFIIYILYSPVVAILRDIYHVQTETKDKEKTPTKYKTFNGEIISDRKINQKPKTISQGE